MRAMTRRAALWAAVLAALAGCGQPPAPTAEVPAFPAIQADVFPAEVRPEIEQRLAAAQASPENAEAAGALGMLLHAHQQFENAEALYERAATLEPSALKWRYYTGVVRSERGDAEGAADALRAALEIDGSFLPARRRLAETLIGLNQLDDAASAYESLLEASPNDPEARFGLGRVLALQGSPTQAIEELSEAVRILPDYGAAHYELSLAYRDAGQPDLARRHLDLYGQRKGAPRSPDPLMAAVDALAQGAGDHIRRGVELEEKGDLAGAIREHLQAIEADGDIVQAHVNLVSLYGRTGNPDKAAEHYEKARALNPGQADLHYNYGVLLFSEERFAEAREAFERALEANPSYATAHNNLGQILERERRFEEATEHYRAAVEAQPLYRLARFHLGRMLMAKRQPLQAAEQFERAIEPRDEMTPQVLFALAAAKAQAGEPDQALRYGEQAVALARQMGQAELARRIEQDLAKLR